jgi:hypothetical protein
MKFKQLNFSESQSRISNIPMQAYESMQTQHIHGTQRLLGWLETFNQRFEIPFFQSLQKIVAQLVHYLQHLKVKVN